MGYYNEKLRELKEQMARHERLKEELHVLQKEKEIWGEKVSKLNAEVKKEEKDVKRVEGPGIVSFYYDMLDKKYEQLDKEQQELVAKVAEYNAAAEQLKVLEQKVDEKNRERLTICDAANQYARVYNLVLKDIKSNRITVGGETQKLLQRIDEIDGQLLEIADVIYCGNRANVLAEKIWTYMEVAYGFGCADSWGIDMIGAVGKYSALKKVDGVLDELCKELVSFRTELLDINLGTVSNMEIEGILHWADLCSQGDWYADEMVLKEMEKFVVDFRRTRNHLTDSLEKLNKLKGELETENKMCNAKLAEIFENADI